MGKQGHWCEERWVPLGLKGLEIVGRPPMA